MSQDPEVPLPSYRPTPAVETECDSTFALRLQTALGFAGVEASPKVYEALKRETMNWRVEELNRMGAAYFAVSMFSANLVRLIRTMKGASHPHPHGTTPRVLVFANEFDAVVNAAPATFLQPAVEEALRICTEVSEMMLARKEADSARAALTRIASDLSNAYAAPELTRSMEVAEAAAKSIDLAHTELRTRDTRANPTTAELAAAYYPVVLKEPGDVRDGDVLFEPTEKQVLYEHGNPRETLSKDAGAENVVAQLKKGGVVVMRPFGIQAVLTLRLRSAQSWVKRLLATEKQHVSKPLHKGRYEGLQMANEFLTLDPWFLPPVMTNAPVAKSDETSTTG